MHLDTKKLSATRNVIFGLHDLLGGWYLAHPLFNGKIQIQHFSFCLALMLSLRRLGLYGWMDGCPHWLFPAF
jgi:hypothetical protein